MALLLVLASTPATAAAPRGPLTAPVTRAATVVETASGPAVVRHAEPTARMLALAPDVRVHADGAEDPYRIHQWALEAVDEAQLLSGERGDGVVVAILDSGVHAAHPELRGAVVPGWSAFGDDPSIDVLGHGTGVAGIIAAQADDGTGMAGLADGVSVMPVKVIDDTGAGWASDVAEGIIWAVDHGADVLNLSLTATQEAPVLADAVAYALAADVPVIASAGNLAAQGNPTVHPAAQDGVIGVAALDRTLEPASFAGHGAWVDVAAPGAEVMTLAPDGYAVADGGSFAAPHVTAATALVIAAQQAQPAVRQAVPDRRAAAQVVLDHAVDLGPAGHDTATGAGLVDLGRALAALGPRTVGAVDPVTAAAELSTAAVGAGRASHAVVVSADAWADALPATALAGVGNPILLAGQELPAVTAVELQRALAPGATVHVLGGAAAVGPAVDAAIADLGFAVERIAGPTRIHTALAVARTVTERARPRTVVIASAAGWADAVSGGVVAATAGAPILLTAPDALDADVAALLAEIAPDEVVLLGGTGVLGPAVADGVTRVTGEAPVRLAGPSRTATALAVAATTTGTTTGVTVIDGWASDGWVTGLAAAPLGLPVLMAGGDGALDGASAAFIEALGSAGRIVRG